MEHYRNPAPAVDIIIELDTGGIVLIRIKNPPPGWALPGGFIDYGESAEKAAMREAKEETSLDVQLVELLHVYSDPNRDPRQHTISTVFIAAAQGVPHGADDATETAVVTEQNLPTPLAFDHAKILHDYFTYKRTGQRPRYS
jgi:ADP-ribose pyrophosphatase YjhB (NUDIX family)